MRLDQLPCGEVGAADVARLPGPDDVVERAHRLFDRRADIREVDLVEVDVVRAEAPQARFDRVVDVASRCAAMQRAFARRSGELRGDDDVLALTLQGFAEILLREATRAVNI